jgi:hypothetical protein
MSRAWVKRPPHPIVPGRPRTSVSLHEPDYNSNLIREFTMSDINTFSEKVKDFLISKSPTIGLILIVFCVTLPACCMFTGMLLMIVRLIERVATQGT